MSEVTAELRRLVKERAGNRCEYCGLSQMGQEATFHIDHVTPDSAGGPTESENLALASVSCSLRKGARQRIIDLQTGDEVLLFNPRTDNWSDHFRWSGNEVVGVTATARATIHALQMNRPLIVAIRYEESLRGRHPPPT